jgi:hypothetical protein
VSQSAREGSKVFRRNLIQPVGGLLLCLFIRIEGVYFSSGVKSISTKSYPLRDSKLFINAVTYITLLYSFTPHFLLPYSAEERSFFFLIHSIGTTSLISTLIKPPRTHPQHHQRPSHFKSSHHMDQVIPTLHHLLNQVH